MLARWRHPLAMVERAKREAGVAEARFQLTVLDAIDLADESEAERDRIAEWRRALTALLGQRKG